MPGDTPLWKAHDLSQAMQDKLETLPGVERAFVHVDHETTHRPVCAISFRSFWFPLLISIVRRNIASMFEVPEIVQACFCVVSESRFKFFSSRKKSPVGGSKTPLSSTGIVENVYFDYYLRLRGGLVNAAPGLCGLFPVQ